METRKDASGMEVTRVALSVLRGLVDECCALTCVLVEGSGFMVSHSTDFLALTSLIESRPRRNPTGVRMNILWDLALRRYVA